MNLAEKSALVQYKTNEIGPQEICDYIDDMGFEASLPSMGGDRSLISTCVVHIDGMTCNSCVQTIEGNLHCFILYMYIYI